MTSDDETISDGLAAQIIDDLSLDELEKVYLIVCRDVDQMNGLKNNRIAHLEWDGLTFGHKREIWIEMMFLVKRYDLLRSLASCKTAAQQQIAKKTYFPLIKRLLLKVYEGMTSNKEDEFRVQMKRMCPLKGNATGEGLASLLLGSNFGDDLHLKQLRLVFKEMGWLEMVEEIKTYLKSVSGDYVIDRSHETIGLCLIVNNMTSTRRGSQTDIKLLRDVFREFRFKVIEYLDVSCSELIFELQKVAAMDHSDESVFVCCLMSHGSKDALYCQDMRSLSIKKEIIREFHGDRCPTLKEKPKLFFVQACRSFPDSTVGPWTTDAGSDALTVPDSNPSDVHNEADILQSYATVEGDEATRFEEGSPYIKALVNNLREFGKTLNILTILTKVNKDVPKDVFAKEGCQQPTFETSLSKTLKLG